MDPLNPIPLPEGITETEVRGKMRTGLDRGQAIDVITQQRAHDAHLAKQPSAKPPTAPKALNLDQLKDEIGKAFREVHSEISSLKSKIAAQDEALNQALALVKSLDLALATAVGRVAELEKLAADNAAAASAAAASGAQTATTSEAASAAKGTTAKAGK